MGEQNCQCCETAVGGIEPPSPRLTVRRFPHDHCSPEIDYVMILIVLVNSFQDISSAMSVTWECISNASKIEKYKQNSQIWNNEFNHVLIFHPLCVSDVLYCYSNFFYYMLKQSIV